MLFKGGPNRIVQSPVSPVVSRLKTGGRKPVFKTPFHSAPSTGGHRWRQRWTVLGDGRLIAMSFWHRLVAGWCERRLVEGRKDGQDGAV